MSWCCHNKKQIFSYIYDNIRGRIYGAKMLKRIFYSPNLDILLSPRALATSSDVIKVDREPFSYHDSQWYIAYIPGKYPYHQSPTGWCKPDEY